MRVRPGGGSRRAGTMYVNFIDPKEHARRVFTPGARAPVAYTGHSIVVGPLGDVLVEGGDEAELLTVELDLDAVAEARRTNPSLANRRM